MWQLDFGHREGRHGVNGQLQMADSKRGFRRTALEHMNDTTNDLAALTQRRHMERPCYQIE
jgi:hypothetical protein